MTKKRTPAELEAVILDAASRSRLNVRKAAAMLPTSKTQVKCQETAARQVERMEKALSELVALATKNN